jgi:hypothetical protein
MLKIYLDLILIFSNGKLIIAKNMEILTANLKSINPKEVINDNELIDINIKELGVSEIYPIVRYIANLYLIFFHNNASKIQKAKFVH